MKKFFVFLFHLYIAFVSANCPDKALINTKIYTLNPELPVANFMTIKKDRIDYVGKKRIDLSKCTSTEVHDLNGSFVFPGFVDSHAHLRGVGFKESSLDLSNTTSKDDLISKVKAYLNENPDISIIVGKGWIEKNWKNKTFPNKTDLDLITYKIPIILERADGHAVIVNSIALELAGISSHTKDPVGGEIEKDEEGDMTGLLIDNAQKLILPLIPKRTDQENEKAFITGSKVYLSRGWTGIHDADSLTIKDVMRYENLDLGLRVHFSLAKDDYNHCQKGSRSIKIYADGAIGSRGAALLESYEDKNSKGLILLDQDIDSYLLKIAQKDCQIQVHAIGDRANQIVIDAFETVFNLFPEHDFRWRIEHAQNVIEEDRKRFKTLKIIASMQPSHAIGDLHFAVDRLGIDRLSNAYTWRSFIDKEVVVVGGSDAPVELGDPIIEFYAAVTRKDLDGFFDDGWNLEQALSREDALSIFTKWPAYAIFKEDEQGTLETGKLADITIFDRDIMTIPDNEILKTKVIMTIVGGKIVYENG